MKRNYDNPFFPWPTYHSFVIPFCQKTAASQSQRNFFDSGNVYVIPRHFVKNFFLLAEKHSVVTNQGTFSATSRTLSRLIDSLYTLNDEFGVPQAKQKPRTNSGTNLSYLPYSGRSLVAPARFRPMAICAASSPAPWLES